MRRRLIGAMIGLAAAAGVLAIVYRMYAPGDLSNRIVKAKARWAVFGRPTTWRFLAQGLLLTIELAIVAIAASLVLGLAFALIRLANQRRFRPPLPAFLITVARVPIVMVVEAVRSSPLFMLIIYAFVGLPRFGVNLSPFQAGVLALTLYTSAVLTEIVRAGVLSLDSGQLEAAESLGLRYGQRLRFVILPQALRRMTPAILAQLVTLVKDTSLVAFITVVELNSRGRILSQVEANPIETALVLMTIYFLINFALSTASRRLERRVPRTQRPPIVIGEEDVAVAAT